MAVEMVRQFVGKVVTVKADRDYVICFDNDCGGTESIQGTFHPTVLKQWHDYETGWRFIGEVTLPDELKRLRHAGTTGEPKSGYHPNRIYFRPQAIQP